MKRTKKKQYWVNSREAKVLQTKANKACMSEAAFVRSLIMGHKFHEKPDDRFYEDMDAIRKLASSLERIASVYAAEGVKCDVDIALEIQKLHRLEFEIEEKFLLA